MYVSNFLYHALQFRNRCKTAMTEFKLTNNINFVYIFLNNDLDIDGVVLEIIFGK